MPKLAQFAAAAKSEHMTNAAAALGVPQPTMSRSLARLEEELGIQLFVRRGRSVRLTPAGKIFAQYVERAVEEIEAELRTRSRQSTPVEERCLSAFRSPWVAMPFRA